MTIDVNAEKEGLRLSGQFYTVTTETHSALQEVPKYIVEDIRQRIQVQLNCLLNEAIAHRKVK